MAEKKSLSDLGELLLAKDGLDLRALGRDAVVIDPLFAVATPATRVRARIRTLRTLVDRSFGRRRLGSRGRRGSGLDRGGSRLDRSLGLRVGQLTEVGEGFLVGHYAPTLFLRFIDATSSGCGSWPPCG